MMNVFREVERQENINFVCSENTVYWKIFKVKNFAVIVD